MDPYRNPFAPGAGSRPPELAGRDALLESARVAYGRALLGRNARSMMRLGLRGTGKTVLLNEIGRLAEGSGYFVSKIESPEHESLARALRGLRGFASIFKIENGGAEVGVEPEPGLADSGDIQFDLPDLFTAIGKAAQAGGKGWILPSDPFPEI